MGSRSVLYCLSGLAAALLVGGTNVPTSLAQDLLQDRPGGTAALISGNVRNAIMPFEEAFALQLDSAAENQLQLHWRIAPGHYLYRKSLKLRLSDGTILEELALPAGEAIEDEFFGAVEVYFESLVLPLPPALLAAASAGAEGSLSLEVQSQGCAEDRYCYPPHRQTLLLPLP